MHPGNEIAEEKHDIVVVGAGAAGLSAAISAAEEGAQVAVVEKAADLKRTNTSRSGGFISVAMERELNPQGKRLLKVHFNTKALKLYTSPVGKVKGVLARSPEGPKLFLGKTTILATAEFQANQEMLLKYFGPDFAYNIRLTGSPLSTGDGILMAQETGAQLVNMDQFHSRNIDDSWVPGSSGMWGPVRELQTLCHYGIFINSLGKRFMDEADTSDIIAASIIRQPEGWVSIIWDEKIREIAPLETENYRPHEMILRAATIDELAGKIKVPLDILLQTIHEFNKAVEGDSALKLDIPKRSFAQRIETPPFYAISPVRCGLNCTLGGVRINTRGQVLDRDGKAIPGLFAAGEMVGGFFFGRYFKTRQGSSYYKGNYQVTAASLSVCIAFGRIAGKNAARLTDC